MGNILCCCYYNHNDNEKNLRRNQLITNNFCNKELYSYIEYNRHIPFCNKINHGDL
jgi:hypothetical protein